MKPFLQGRPVQKSGALKPLEGGAPAAMPQVRTGTPGHAGVNVETVREGDKVVRIVVTCSCGERIEIDCLYPPGL